MTKKLEKRQQVRDFLYSIKETIANPVAEPGWVLVKRQENMECISQLGFKSQDVKEVLLSLSVEDYCEGPCQDRDQKGEVWIFGKEIENKSVYIKLKLASFDKLKIVRIISFHFSEHPLEPLFKEA